MLPMMVSLVCHLKKMHTSESESNIDNEQPLAEEVDNSDSEKLSSTNQPSEATGESGIDADLDDDDWAAAFDDFPDSSLPTKVVTPFDPVPDESFLAELEVEGGNNSEEEDVASVANETFSEPKENDEAFELSSTEESESSNLSGEELSIQKILT